LAWLPAALLFLTPLGGNGATAEEAPKPLRLCADPANLPFSNADSKTPGLYVEIGQAIGRAMGRPVAPVWNLTYFGKHAVRTTLLAGTCDAFIGLPQDKDFMGPKVIFSKPLLRVGYALVVPKSAAVASLDDLSGRRVAVQFATTPQNLLADRDDIRMVTFREPEEAMGALAAGQVDAAFIWGPIAGYVNKTALKNSYHIVPVDGPGLQWPAAIGFASGQTSLRQQVDQVIDSVAGEIDALKMKYGFSTESPIKLGQSETTPKIILAATDNQPADPAALPSPTASQPAEPAPGVSGQDSAEIAEGRELFDGTCAHCHGPNAVTIERRINLRLMQHRYGDKMDETFITTVTHGRPEKGMPDWTGVFSNDQFTKILAFLHSVQTK
jgi:ABC-type amino acid transport substrate-binding protein/mono/diheme cytochrome c family protein